MALCGLGHHVPVSIERLSNCGRNGTNGCGSARQSDGADTIANHGLLLFPEPLGDDWLARMNDTAGAFMGLPRELRTCHNMGRI
jgi:hypothetical protein